ncbi:hypothetical protein [Streptomyces sp. NPDC047869]|uniref:hypothetical protein n=1 Tax=Streptomyces sp. NPDC047869 TaxID=3154709 RepID=UPI00345127F8
MAYSPHVVQGVCSVVQRRALPGTVLGLLLAVALGAGASACRSSPEQDAKAVATVCDGLLTKAVAEAYTGASSAGVRPESAGGTPAPRQWCTLSPTTLVSVTASGRKEFHKTNPGDVWGISGAQGSIPLGHGWLGGYYSFNNGVGPSGDQFRTEVAVLLDCPQVAGGGLLVAARDSVTAHGEVPAVFRTKLAGLAADAARHTAARWHCRGGLGRTPSGIPAAEPPPTDLTHTTGVCRGVITPGLAEMTGAVQAQGSTPGLALSEGCALKGAKGSLVLSLRARYGPAASVARKAPARFPEPGRTESPFPGLDADLQDGTAGLQTVLWMSSRCERGQGTAHYTLGLPGSYSKAPVPDTHWAQMLRTFAQRSATRHGCSLPAELSTVGEP